MGDDGVKHVSSIMQHTLLHLGLGVIKGPNSFQWEMIAIPEKKEEKCPGHDFIQALCEDKDNLAKYACTDKDKLTKDEAKAFVRDIVLGPK